MSFYKVVRTLLKYPLKLIFGIRLVGEENIPAEGGFLLCANHTSMADVIPIAVGMRHQPRYMAKKEALSVPVLGAFLRSLGAFSVDRGGADIGAVKTAISILEAGGVVSIFPQGHRYPKVAARSTPVRNGAGLIAYRAKCGVLPVYIKSKSGKFGAFRRNDIIYGKLIPYEELGFADGGNGEYKRAMERVYDAICDLGVAAGAPLEVAAANKIGDDAVFVRENEDPLAQDTNEGNALSNESDAGNEQGASGASTAEK